MLFEQPEVALKSYDLRQASFLAQAVEQVLS